ncbi:MAG: NYN domain-containing protein [Candidatus Pacearchaeota archaeon]
MSKKAIIFVDANNWYHNVKKTFRPGDIDIEKISKVISNENDLDIVEIRWYASMPDIKENPLVYNRQRKFLGNLEKKGIKVITRKLQRLSTKELKKKRQELLDSWDLCKVCKPLVEESFLEMSEYNQKEKGIDVWIAIDMVKEAMNNNIEVVVLISGDADFVPALELIKGIGKDVLSCFVTRGFSNELRQKFPYMILNKEKLNDCLRDFKDEKTI